MYTFILALILAVNVVNSAITGEWQLNDSKAKFVNYDNTNVWNELGDDGETRFTFESTKLENKQLLLEDKDRIYLKIAGEVMHYSYNKDDILKDDFNQVLYTGKWIVEPDTTGTTVEPESIDTTIEPDTKSNLTN